MYKGLCSYENITKQPKKSYFEFRIPSVAIANYWKKHLSQTDFSKRNSKIDRFTFWKVHVWPQDGMLIRTWSLSWLFSLDLFYSWQSCNQGMAGGYPKLWIYRSSLWPTQHRQLLFPVLPAEVPGLVFIALAWVLSPPLKSSLRPRSCWLVRAVLDALRAGVGVRWGGCPKRKPRCY